MKYLITYDNGITQQKNLISHKTFLEVIKPAQMQIALLEGIPSKQNKEQIKLLKASLKQFGEWFTDESPLFESIQSGYLEIFGGKKIKVKWILKEEWSF